MTKSQVVELDKKLDVLENGGYIRDGMFFGQWGNPHDLNVKYKSEDIMCGSDFQYITQSEFKRRYSNDKDAYKENNVVWNGIN